MNFIVILIIVIFTYFLFRNNDRKSKINSKIKGPISLPIVGNLLSIYKKPHINIHKWYKKYGPIYRIQMGTIDTVVLTEYPILKEAFIDNSDAFASRFQRRSRFRVNNCETLTMSNGELHSKLKKVVLSEMTPMKIKKMEIEIEKECQELISHLDVFAVDSLPIQLNIFLKMFSMNIILRFLFGIDFPYLNRKKEDEKISEIINEFIKRAGSPILSDYLPFLDRFDKSEFFELYPVLIEHIEKLIEKYKSKQKPSSSSKSIGADHPQNSNDESIFGKFLIEFEKDNISYQQIISSCIDTFIAGTDTSSNTMMFFILNLVNNPDIQDRLHREIESVVFSNKQKQDESLSSSPTTLFSRYRSSLPYFSMVLKETFRIFPISLLGVPHVTTQDIEINGITIAEGTQIIQNIYSSHRCEKFFPSPDEFRPERFQNSISNPKSFGSHTQLVHFGCGIRDCVGKSLAEAELFTILVTLIHRYEFTNPKPAIPIQISNKDYASQPNNPYIIISKRKGIN